MCRLQDRIQAALFQHLCTTALTHFNSKAPSGEQPHPLLQFLRPLLGRLRDVVLVGDSEAGVLGDELDLGEQDVPPLFIVVSQQYSKEENEETV